MAAARLERLRVNLKFRYGALRLRGEMPPHAKPPGNPQYFPIAKISGLLRLDTWRTEPKATERLGKLSIYPLFMAGVEMQPSQ